MRIPLTRCALIVLSLLMLAGCQGGQSSSLLPDWSFLKWRPFSPSSEYAAASRPELPSSQVSTAPTYSSAGYATASEPADPPGGSSYSPYSSYGADGYDASPGGYIGSEYKYPPTSSADGYGSATGAAATPQDGLYNPNGYGAAGTSSGLGAGSSSDLPRYSSDTGSGLSGSPSSTLYGSTDRNYEVAGATGPYGYPSDTTPRYEVDSGRYGSGGAAADPYASVRDHNGSRYSDTSQGLSSGYRDAIGSGYGAGASGGYDGAQTSGDSYWSDSGRAGPERTSGPTTAGTSSSYDNSSFGSRYAQPATESTGAAVGYNSYINGRLGNSQPTDDWNPGGPTSNMPGGSDYDPGNTGYDPGNTGYNPPGVSPYRSPASSYVSPDSGTDASSAPFRPGSTGRFELRNPGLPDMPEGAPSLDPTLRPSAGSNSVVPAYYSR